VNRAITRGRVSRLRRALLLCATAAILGGERDASAQQPDGQLRGQVLDSTGLPLPGVLVELEPSSRTITGRTGPDGMYQVPAPPGTYGVRFSLASFVTVLRRDVVIRMGERTTENVTLYVAATASVVVSGTSTFRNLATIGNQDELVGVADAASTGVITPGELNERVRRRPAEALESVPGMVVSQHSGEGKANQYYLRGFNIDHGTDLSLSLAGMPVNLPTHGHGQGYADLNFLIPELVSGIQYRKGTYAAEAGDFAAAGTIRINYLNVLDGPVARVEGGASGYGRLFGAASPRVGSGHLLVAAEVMGNDGPWERPDNLRKWNGVVRYSQGTSTTGFSLTGLAYSSNWDASDQIPRRAVEDGSLSRFGYVDRTNGGDTHRAGGIAEWQRTTTSGITRAEGYVFDYGLDLFSNFTYFLDDPDNGDQFEQRDDRVAFGGRASRAWSLDIAGRRSMITVGGEMRRDAIGTVGLYRTVARERLSTVREDSVGQTSGAGYAELQTRWSDVLRTTVGLRGDVYRWNVDAGDPANGGTESDAIVNPKASVAFGPWRQTEFYAGAGGGFHSNDGRGSTITRDPVTGAPADPVDPLVRARAAEVGLRSLAVPRLHTTVSLWSLWIDSELLFIGDAGTTEPSRPSRRFGFEWDADYRAASWFTLDGSVAYSQARFTDASSDGDRVPGAIEGVAQAGVTIAPEGRWSGSLRWRYFGPRPLIEDNSVRSRASSMVSAEAGVRVNRIWRVKADLLNLFDSESSDIDYFYTSRLRGEPAGGVDGLHFHPVEPFTVRVALVASF
jgi:hypothetical protein